MKIELTFWILILLLFACNDNKQKSNLLINSDKNTIDTIVGTKTITDEIAGSTYRKRAIGYFVIFGKDTSSYTCIFTESKEVGDVGIDLNIKYIKTSMTYRQRFEELKIILSKASKDFNFDSLTSIRFGRLILSGDLAVEITKQYQEKFGTSDKLEHYPTVEQFLKESKLGTDLNDLLKPYSIYVEKVTIEKLFLTTPKELCHFSKIEMDTTKIPNKILDCMIWVKLTKK